MNVIDHEVQHEIMGFGGLAKRSIKSIAVIGDSTTSDGAGARWGGVGFFARSNAQSLTAGDGTLTIYSGGTATWQAPGDTGPGEAVEVGEGIVYLESASADMGAAFNITQAIVDLCDPAGSEIEITIEAKAIGFSDHMPFVWGQIISGQKLALTACLGIDGETTAGLLARLPQVFLIDNLGGPVESPPDCVHVLIGINDVDHIVAEDAGYSIEETLANLTAIHDYIASRGALCLFGTIAQESPSADELELILQINAHIRSFQNGSNITRVPDYFYAMRNGDIDTGAAYSGYMDGPHFTTVGAIAAGRVLAAAINEITGSAVGRSRFRFAGDTSNLVTNGAMLGTDGVTAGAGFTGDLALTCFIADDLIVAGSKVTDPAETPWQVFTVTDSAADDYIIALPAMTLPDSAATADVEFHISDATDVKSIDLCIQYGDGDSTTEVHHAAKYSQSSSTLGTGELSGVLRTNAAGKPAWAVSALAIVHVIFGADATTVVKIRALGASES